MKNIPTLRFPEFVNDGEWEEKKLSDTVDKKIKWSFIGGPFGSNLKASDYTIQGIRVIQLQNIGDGEFQNNYKIYTSNQKADELLSNNIYPNEIILSKMGDPVARACIIPDNEPRYVMCSDGIRLVVDEKKFHKYFIFSMINSDLFRNLADKTATGSTRKRIGLDDLKNLPIVIPSLQEQQKIANCLSSVDGLISAQSQKVELLKEHKKGLMQQLFPSEGESVPKLRFPEFVNDGEWEEKILDDVVNRYDNLRVPVSAINRIAGKTPYYGANGIQGYVSGYTHDGEFILIAEDGANDLKNYPVQYVNGKIWVNNHAHVLQAKKNIAYNRFLKFAISKINIEPFLVGGGRAKLNANIMMKLKINIPKPKEQQKIADCLSSLDEQITQQTSKLQTLKEHKKALMQQLFPSNHPALSGTPPTEGNSKDENVGDNSQNSPSLKGWQTKSDGVVKSKTTQEDKHA